MTSAHVEAEFAGQIPQENRHAGLFPPSFGSESQCPRSESMKVIDMSRKMLAELTNFHSGFPERLAKLVLTVEQNMKGEAESTPHFPPKKPSRPPSPPQGIPSHSSGPVMCQDKGCRRLVKAYEELQEQFEFQKVGSRAYSTGRTCCQGAGSPAPHRPAGKNHISQVTLLI